MRLNSIHLAALVALFSSALRGGAQEPRRADPNALLPSGAVARLGSARFVHGDKLIGLTLSPDGSVVLGADWRHVYLWDAKTGRQLREFTGIKSVQRADLSPDGKTVAAVENGSRVWLWDAATGKELRRLTAKATFRPDALCWSPDSKWIVVGTGEVVCVWEAGSGKPVHELNHKSVTSLAVSPDRKLILTGSFWNSSFRLWDGVTGKELRQLEGGGGNSNVAFSPDGKTIVGYYEQKSGVVTSTGMRTWDVETGEKLRRDFAGGWYAFGGFSADGKTVYAARDGNIYVWDTKTREELRKWKAADDGLHNMSLSGDGKWLAGDVAGRIRIWEVATGKERTPPTGHTLGVTSVSFSPDGKTIASGSADCTLRIWDWTTGRELHKHHQKTWCGINGLAHRPDGRVVVLDSWSMDGLWRVWDPATGRTVLQFKGDGYARGLVLDASGNTAYSAGRDGCIGVWDVTKGKELRRMVVGPKPKEEEGSFASVECIALAPDGRRVAWTRYDGPAGVLDVATGKSVLELKAPEGEKFDRIAYSPEQTCLATSTGGTVRLWHPETGKQLAEWTESPGALFAFSPDGRFIATADADQATSPDAVAGEVAVWDVAARKELFRFRGHRAHVNALTFEPRGRVLVSASADGILLVWDLTGQMKDGKLPNEKPSDKSLEAAWADLRSDDATRAQRAVVALACAAPDSVAFIEKRLKPVPVVPPARLTALVADLGAGEFKVRDRAMRDLAALGEVAEPALRQALKSDNPEARDRAAELLRPLGKLKLTVEQVRAQRGVAALAYTGGPEARRLLLRLADGEPAARLTRQAKAAAERLALSEGGSR